jgi:hypothetical protein
LVSFVAGTGRVRRTSSASKRASWNSSLGAAQAANERASRARPKAGLWEGTSRKTGPGRQGHEQRRLPVWAKPAQTQIAYWPSSGNTNGARLIPPIATEYQDRALVSDDWADFGVATD